MTMIAKDWTPWLGRLLAVLLVLLGAAAINAAWAEDAAPNATPASSQGGNNDPGSAGSTATKGNETGGNKPVGDKVDTGSEGSGDHHAGSGDGAKGGEEAANKGTQHGEDHGGVKHDGTEASPIDTRITVLGKPRSGRALSWHDRKKTKLVRPQGTSGDHRPKLTRTNKDNVVRNAIGQRVPLTKGVSNNTDKKGLEATFQNLPKSTGASQNSGAGAGGPNPQHQGFVPAPARDGGLRALPLNTAINRSTINGTGMVRPGVRIGAIGGATKNVPGVINGTDFHPRHP
jgi:hypothetical protein